MLTKDLLQFSHRKGRITPTFIEENRPTLQKIAGDLVASYRTSVGRTAKEIERSSNLIDGREACMDGLRKLLNDRCVFETPADAVMERRWELIRTAQDLRDEGNWGAPEDYGRQMEQRCSDNLVSLRASLYSDHPDERSCESFEDIEPSELLADYNRAQLQTLFIFADDVKITIKGATLPEKRAFFRQLKFHSLMGEVAVDPDDATMTIYLSGPLKLFQKSTTYGLRLARFILNVLHLKVWELEATIQLKNKHLQLKLDSECGVKPRGRGLTGYVPEEFISAMTIFNAGEHGWLMKQSEDFIHIGKQSYCFPDFDLVSGKKHLHVELFHPWHKGQIVGRLAALDSSKIKNLIVGLDKSLLKDKDTFAAQEKSKWFQTYGFQFSQFPTPKQLLKAVDP
ncbi:MAG: DUF790 family protein [Proteobacteria bacterium]|nr:DUF790 family protein [Pseudomonadota bacterium]